MKPPIPPFSVMVLSLALAACATEREPRGRWAQTGGPPGPRLFVSPAGEPFRPAGGGAQPMQAWFTQADLDRDNSLSYAEFLADFVRAFGTYDVDGDGEIAPAEITRYETELLPEMARRGGGPGAGGVGDGPRGGRGGMGRGPRPGGGGGMRRGGGRGGGGGGGGRAVAPDSYAMTVGAARFGLLPISHPIRNADLDFNGGVSRTEFEAAAQQRFNLLNAAGTGRLTLENLEALRARSRRGGPPGERPRG